MVLLFYNVICFLVELIEFEFYIWKQRKKSEQDLDTAGYTCI